MPAEVDADESHRSDSSDSRQTVWRPQHQSLWVEFDRYAEFVAEEADRGPGLEAEVGLQANPEDPMRHHESPVPKAEAGGKRYSYRLTFYRAVALVPGLLSSLVALAREDRADRMTSLESLAATSPC